MPRTLRILVVLDDEGYLGALLARLDQGGFSPRPTLATTPQAFRSLLESEDWDLVLAARELPGFGAAAALELLRETERDVPLLVVAGGLEENAAVALARAGALDTIEEDRLERLVPAVERALREVADRRRSREAAAALQLGQAITAAANEALSIPDALQVTLDRICTYADWPVGHLLMPEAADGALASARIWHLRDPARFEGFRLASEASLYGPETGLPGRVLAARAAVWLEDLERAPGSARSGPAREAGLQSGFAFPILAGDDVVAVLEFFSDRPRPPEQHLLELTQRLAVQMGPVMERIRATEALRESEARYRLLFQGSPHPMWFHDARSLAILAVNDVALQTYGYSRSEFLAMTLNDLWAAPESPAFRDGVRRTQRGLKWQHRRKDGSVIDVEVSSQAVTFGGRRARLVLAQDVSDRKRAEKALRESERRYARAVAGANDGLWDWDLTTGEVYYSPRWKALLGYGEEEIGNSPEEWLGRVHPEDAERLRSRIASHLREAQGHLEEEHRVRHRDGTWRWMLGRGRAVWTADGGASRMAGSLTDISVRKQAEEQLLHDAYHDALTGLPNRALFLDRLDHAASRRRDRHPFGVLFLDLDRFKVVNDGLGHAIGDQLLVGVARKLQNVVRAGDTVARMGGDEFTILLEEVADPGVAMRTADRILRELTRPMDLSGHQVATTASIGIALSAAGFQQAADLVRDADTAMYRAKALGKGRYELFDPAMHHRMVALLRLEEDLRAALERHELRVHYQPIVNIASGRVAGFEALLRWEHPLRGNIPPDEFIPLAEETGLIVPIGQWLRREACQRLRTWQGRFPTNPPLTMSVNLSARELAEPGLPDGVADTLRLVGLAPQSLTLEITESRLESGEPAVADLNRLKALGVELAVDDFGTGYSGLSRLTRLPIDALKIDRSFVMGLGEAQNREIVRMILALTEVLGIDAVAEGVETAEQLAVLRGLGCEFGQGYLFSRAVPAEAAESFLAAQGREDTDQARNAG
jgi:diguanylate cyclase (GGDEF)-like protein/PAS domain S-box-containing protein